MENLNKKHIKFSHFIRTSCAILYVCVCATFFFKSNDFFFIPKQIYSPLAFDFVDYLVGKIKSCRKAHARTHNFVSYFSTNWSRSHHLQIQELEFRNHTATIGNSQLNIANATIPDADHQFESLFSVYELGFFFLIDKNYYTTWASE